MFRSFSLFILSIQCFALIAQPASKKISRAEYIETYKEVAIEEMHRSGIPASITLAQGILESGDGNSPLARYANNHFGIKCHSDWTGKRFIQDDDAKDECFRKYKNAMESFHDHSEFLKKKRYAFLFALEKDDYKGWAHGLKKAGYATNPKYPQLLIDIIEKNDLAQFDQSKAGKSKSLAKKQNNNSDAKTLRRGSHEVKIHENNIRYVEVKPEDNIEKIADEFEMGEWQIYKYNDIEKEEPLFDSGVLFLQPKRRKAQAEFHEVREGESMWEISQLHGIKLKKLYRKNRMEVGESPKVGTKLHLQKNKRRE